MSSTNRGGERSPADNYPTPREATAALLHRLTLPGGTWVEPCAGEGAIIREVMRWRQDVRWIANELRQECEQGLDDLLGWESCSSIDARELAPLLGDNVEVIITNPPFSLSLEIVKALWGKSRHLVILEKITFLGEHKGQRRSEWLAANPPDVYYMPERLSFTADGRTDSIPYAWFHWDLRNVFERECWTPHIHQCPVTPFRSHSMDLFAGR